MSAFDSPLEQLIAFAHRHGVTTMRVGPATFDNLRKEAGEWCIYTNREGHIGFKVGYAAPFSSGMSLTIEQENP